MSMEVPQRTWDGLAIAVDRPSGATVVVRRPGPDGVDLLLLHRAAHGIDFDGDWAWTCPAGCRQPGEAVYPAALRELAEEAGLAELKPWAVDLSGPWAVFAVDVPLDCPVTLVDPEHDRYVWAAADAAADRVLPTYVGSQQRSAAAVPGVRMTFRAMTARDLPAVARWLAAPHVQRWWADACGDEDAVAAKYAPRLRGEGPTRMWVVEIDDQPAGMLQYYAVDAEPSAVGFDYLIGEASYVGSGLGTRMVWEFCRDVLRPRYPQMALFVASPSEHNHASLRVLAKCGFTIGRRVASAQPPDAQSGQAPPHAEVLCSFAVRHWLG